MSAPRSSTGRSRVCCRPIELHVLHSACVQALVSAGPAQFFSWQVIVSQALLRIVEAGPGVGWASAGWTSQCNAKASARQTPKHVVLPTGPLCGILIGVCFSTARLYSARRVWLRFWKQIRTCITLMDGGFSSIFSRC